MSNKVKHIVFQVLNFLHSDHPKAISLIPIDRLILINLASHQGHLGIFPKQETLAIQLKTSLRYMKTRLKYLEKEDYLSVENINRKNHYTFLFLSTIGDPQITQDENIGDPQIISQVIYRSPNRGSTDHPNNKLNNKLNNRESARKERAPLSPSWNPDQKRTKLLKETTIKSGKTEDQLLTKFRNLQLTKNKTSLDWQAEFENFLINERPSFLQLKQPPQTTRSTVQEWGPGHPGYDSLHGVKTNGIDKTAERSWYNIN